MILYCESCGRSTGTLFNGECMYCIMDRQPRPIDPALPWQACPICGDIAWQTAYDTSAGQVSCSACGFVAPADHWNDLSIGRAVLKAIGEIGDFDLYYTDGAWHAVTLRNGRCDAIASNAAHAIVILANNIRVEAQQ